MEKREKLPLSRHVFSVFQYMGIIIIFIKNLSQYVFISISCLLYACLLADYQSAWQEGRNCFRDIENSINC